VSDPRQGVRKPNVDEDVDELPGESAPSAGVSQLSLEEQIAQLSDLEIEGDPPEAQKKP
jgi:hypothetical protein